jgi:flagellar motor switch protein FliM
MAEESKDTEIKETTAPQAEAATSAVPLVSGIKAVLEKSLQSYEKLPMLDIILYKFVRQLSTALRNLTSEVVDVSISEFNSLRFGSYFATVKNPHSIVVFKAVEWENWGLVTLENSLIFFLVDLLLGGKKNVIATQETPLERDLTSIEKGIARQFSEIFLSELSQSFDQITPTTFTFDRMETNHNFVNIVRTGDAVIVLKLIVEIENQKKNIDLLIPYKTLEPVKEKMQQVFLGDSFGADKVWEKQLTETVMDIDLPVEAVITNRPATIEEVANLKIGDTIVMNHDKDEDIIVRSGAIELFTGKIGKVDDKVAINLNKIIS